MDRRPPDWHRAERAYDAFYNEQPQIFFHDLSHLAQMRWINAIRAAFTERKRQIMKTNGLHKGKAWTPAQHKKFKRTMKLKKLNGGVHAD